METSIQARICGKSYTCELHREDLSLFESVHGTAFAMLQKIRAGAWSVDDLANVIDFATSPRPKAASVNEYQMLSLLKKVRGKDHLKLSEGAFPKNGPAVYVPLALGILTAALFGLPAEDAQFSDEEASDV